MEDIKVDMTDAPKELANFVKLYTTNVNKFTETKEAGYGRKLTYLSWAPAWAQFCKVYPNATYEVICNKDGLPYFASEKGCMVFTTVTVGNITHKMWLPVMDSANNAQKDVDYTLKTKNADKLVKAYDMFDVNKTIMRCLVKNLAMFGLGLYIYAGEDLPENIGADDAKPINKPVEAKLQDKAPEPPKALDVTAELNKLDNKHRDYIHHAEIVSRTKRADIINYLKSISGANEGVVRYEFYDDVKQFASSYIQANSIK